MFNNEILNRFEFNVIKLNNKLDMRFRFFLELRRKPFIFHNS